MKACWGFNLLLLTILAVVVFVAESGGERELIQDNHFQRGFIL
jgi:hypothetical protein